MYTISSWYLTQSIHNILDHLWGNHCCWKMKQHILRFPQSLILIFLWIHVQNDCRCRKQFASSFLCQLWHENTFCHKTFNSTIFLLKVLRCRYILCCQQTILIDDMRLSSALKRFLTGQTIPAICTNFKLVKTTNCSLKEHQSAFTTHPQCWQHDSMS